MNVVIKMMDADNTGFRLLTVNEPVDVHVKAYNPPSFQKPVLVVGHGLAALNKTYDVNGNVYIMNEAGDTISKVDYADVSKGMPEPTKQPIVESMAGSSLRLGIQPIRELGPVHIDDSEDRDCGVLLKNWSKESDEIGGYFDGYFKALPSITSIMIRQFKAYAKPETVEEIRKTGDWPETKLAMLTANDKLVNPPLTEVTVEEGSMTIKSTGELNITGSVTVSGNIENPVKQLKLWEKVLGHLNESISIMAMEELEALTYIENATIRGTVTNDLKHGAILTTLKDGRIVNAYSKELVIQYSPEETQLACKALFQASVDKDKLYELFEFKRNATGIVVSVVEPTPIYARYEQDVPERDSNGAVVLDGNGMRVIKHKKGDVILDQLLQPIVSDKQYLG